MARCITILGDNIGLADHVIQDVLRFSRKSENLLEKISVDSLKDDVLGFIKNLVHSRIKLVFDIQGGISDKQSVEINVNGLHQILMNIVSNALHAMKDSGQLRLYWYLEKIYTAIRMNLAEGSYLCIGIEDTGNGMTKNNGVCF